MRLFDLFKRKKNEAPYTVQYRLHIVCVIEGWNQMQQRDFVAVDIQKRKFYRVHEELGAWMAAYYFVKTIDTEELKRLFNMASKCNLENIHLIDNDWTSFVVALQNAEIVEITQNQLFPKSEI